MNPMMLQHLMMLLSGNQGQQPGQPGGQVMRFGNQNQPFRQQSMGAGQMNPGANINWGGLTPLGGPHMPQQGMVGQGGFGGGMQSGFGGGMQGGMRGMGGMGGRMM